MMVALLVLYCIKAIIVASASPYIAKHWEERNGSGQDNYIEGAAGAYEYDGRTVYYSGGGSNKVFSEYANVPINDVDPSIEIHLRDVAWTMIYGDIECPEPPEPCEDVEMLPHSPCKKHDIYIPSCDLGCPPVRIEITVLPDKLNYQSGEEIDLTGIVVRAFKANGNLWGGFPHGIIPIEQLGYEPKVAISEHIDFPEYQNSGTVFASNAISPLELFDYVLENGISHYTGEATINAIRSELMNYDCLAIAQVNERNGAGYQGWSPISMYLYSDLMPGNQITLGSHLGILMETYGQGMIGQTMTLSNYRFQSGYAGSVFIGQTHISNYWYVSGINATQAASAITVSWQYGDETFTDTFDITVQ